MASMDVKVDLVTPAYAGGASTQQCDGLRPPVLKALLRFWWRAMHPELLPADLFAREEQLFGSTCVGQGLRVVPQGPWQEPACDLAGTLERSPLHVYLAYGPVAWDAESTADPQRVRQGKKGASVTKTPRVHAGHSQQFRLILPRGGPHDAYAQTVRALWLLSAFGTFGSRARRGWGSLRVRCEAFDEEASAGLRDPHGGSDLHHSVSILRNGLESILGPREAISLPEGSSEPQHTAFSPHYRAAIGPPAESWERALTTVRDAYEGFHRALGAYRRQSGGDHPFVGEDFEKRYCWAYDGFPPDPNEDGISEERKQRRLFFGSTPLGTAFGLPHNAQFSPPGQGARVNVGVGPGLAGRRASPVFLKVLRCGQGYVPLVLWLPARFLPTGDDAYAVYAQSPEGTARLTYAGDAAIRDFFDGNTGLRWYPSPGNAAHWTGILAGHWQRVEQEVP